MPSSVIASMKYDPEEQVLTIVFLSGSVYQYLAVPEEEYMAMKAAFSKGIYLNEHIKPKYDFVKVR